MGGTATTDATAIKGVRGGARPPTPRSVEAERRRQEAQPALSMAWSEPVMTGSELFCDNQRITRTRGSTHLSNGSEMLYCVIMSDGDKLLPREPLEVDKSSEEQ